MRSSSGAEYSALMPSRLRGESRPSVRFSIERSAFCSAIANVRPMDITSPTDFMLVVSV